FDLALTRFGAGVGHKPLSPCGRGRLAEGERGEGCACSASARASGSPPLQAPLSGKPPSCAILPRRGGRSRVEQTLTPHRPSSSAQPSSPASPSPPAAASPAPVLAKARPA